MPVVRIWRRDVAAQAAVASREWEMQVRPRRAVRTAWIVAILLFLVFAVGGVWLQSGSTGVNFRAVDQVAMVCIGLLLAGAVLTLTRPRVRADARGVSVRNVLGDDEFAWRDIRGVSFPDRKAWARLELVNDDYVPLLAIRANDKEHAARAMDRLRELGATYGTRAEDAGSGSAGRRAE